MKGVAEDNALIRCANSPQFLFLAHEKKKRIILVNLVHLRVYGKVPTCRYRYGDIQQTYRSNRTCTSTRGRKRTDAVGTGTYQGMIDPFLQGVLKKSLIIFFELGWVFSCVAQFLRWTFPRGGRKKGSTT